MTTYPFLKFFKLALCFGAIAIFLSSCTTTPPAPPHQASLQEKIQASATTAQTQKKFNRQPYWLKREWNKASSAITKTRAALEKEDPDALHKLEIEFGSNATWVVDEVINNLRSMEAAMESNQFQAMLFQYHEIPESTWKRMSSDLPNTGGFTHFSGKTVLVDPHIRDNPNLSARLAIVHGIAHLAAGAYDYGYVTQIQQRDYFNTPNGPTRMTLDERLANADTYASLVLKN